MHREEGGASAAEYAIVVAGVAVVILAAFLLFADRVVTLFGSFDLGLT